MRKVLLGLALVCLGCSSDDARVTNTAPPHDDPGAVQTFVRVLNETTADYSSVKIRFPNVLGSINFGEAKAGQLTSAQKVDEAWTIVRVELVPDPETVLVYDPLLLASEPLSAGSYLYRVTQNCHGMSVFVEEDVTSQPDWEPAVKTSVVLSSAQVSAGENVYVQVRMKNLGSKSLFLDGDVSLLITNRDGSDLDQVYECPTLGSISLSPNAERVVLERNMRTGWLAPGSYLIRAGIRSHQDLYPWGSEELVIE